MMDNFSPPNYSTTTSVPGALHNAAGAASDGEVPAEERKIGRLARAGRAWRAWQWWLPVVVLVLFLGAAWSFVALTQRYESGQRSDQQIADTLWVEQAIRFQLSRDEEALSILGADIASGKVSRSNFSPRAEHLLRISRELGKIAWYDAENGTRVSIAPVQVDESDAAAKLPPDEQTDLHRPVTQGAFYFPVHAADGVRANLESGREIDLLVPFSGGVLIATIRLDAVLSEMVPWWFAQDNEVQLVDPVDNVLATRAPGGHGRSIYTHTTMLDLPGNPLYLRTNSVRDKPSLLPNVLAGSVLLLSLTLIWSLWALRRDMLRRARAEQQLRGEHAFRKAMEDSLVTGLRARALDGRVTYVNPAFCKMIGFDAAELLGRLPPMPYWVPEAIEDHQRRFARVLAGGAPSHGYESVFRHKNGARIEVLIYEAPLIDANGVQTGWMSSVLDVTERRHMEEINRQQQEKLQNGARLATMGEIASTLSHELNQPLAAITSYAAGCANLLHRHTQALAEEMAGESADGAENDALADGLADIRALNPDLTADITAAIERILTQAQRAGMIIRSVHDLLKKREPHRTPCELCSVIRSTLPLIDLQARKNEVAIAMHLPDTEIYVSGDRVMLEQVLLNLTRNASEAMRTVERDARIIDIAVECRDDGTVAVSVSDRGPGVAAAVRMQLFTPFYSTKEEGMGMGLSICRTAIEFHGGHIGYAERPGGGAVFHFTLPTLAQAELAS